MTPRLLVMMALAFSAAGCTTGIDPNLVTSSIAPVAPTMIADVSPDYAAAYLPRIAGQVKSVRQSSKPDHIFQTVIYPDPGYGEGENKLSVSIAPPSSGTSYFQAPTQRQIATEMKAGLPGVPMQISTAIGQNLHGRFGYALGKLSSGGSCIFAWQTAKDVARTDQVGVGKLMRDRYAAKIRLRYCHPTISEGGLVSLMSGMRIREISSTTLEMLRFAEGSGVPAQTGYAAEKVHSQPVRKSTKTAIKSVKKTGIDHASISPRNAPRVLKPGELTNSTVAQKKLPAVVTEVASKARSPDIPLPGDVSR